MARPKYYLDTKPTKDGKYQLLLSYSFNRQRLKYYPVIHIYKSDYQPEYWKTNKKPIKSTAAFAAQYNQLLKNIEADAVKLVTETKGEQLTPSYIREQLDLIYKPKPIEPEPQPQPEQTSFIKYFEKAILDSKSGKRVMRKPSKKAGQRYSERAIKNYGIALSALKRYTTHINVNDLEFEDINDQFYNDFMDFCYNEESKEKSTFAGYIKDIKTLMNESGRSNQTTNFIKPSYEADTIALTTLQIQAIADLDLSDPHKVYTDKNGKNISYKTLAYVRDLFLIGAYTGLRFSDFSQLDIKSIDGNFIRLKQTKTGDRVTIPVMSKLSPVLSRYPDKLPEISNQKFNDYIKHVAELSGLTETITITNTKGNKTNVLKSPLYSLVTSHCCRRSYATNMFKAGVPPMLIMSATGHKTESSFLKYIRANNDDKAKLLAEMLKKLGL